jgi:hypothetical protein
MRDCCAYTDYPAQRATAVQTTPMTYIIYAHNNAIGLRVQLGSCQ